MRALKAAVVIMGVLIIGGVITLGVLLAQRVAGLQPGPTATLLDEPAGTRIGSVAATPDRLLVLLQGGGAPDRVVSVEARTGRVIGRVSLTR